MSEIAVFCQTSNANGLGHVVRQIHLSRELQRQGHNVHFYVENFPPALGLLRKAGQSVETGARQQWIPKKPVDMSILDIGPEKADTVARIRTRSRKIACMENIESGRDCVDLLIDCNLDREAIGNVAPSVTCLFGLEYVLLHPDFAMNYSREFPHRPHNILVTLGGTDPQRLTAPVVETLLEADANVKLTVLIGAGFQDPEGLARLQRRGGENLVVLHGAKRMAELLADHDAVVCAGGVTLYEAMATGTPAFAIAQAPHQADKTQRMQALGAAEYLGMGVTFDKDRLRAVLQTPKERLQSLSRTGKSLVDGHGIFRIAAAIENLLQ
jgi:spore coat polysaccharide biosynthesis predicted glycosyltransferase SpsG